MFLGNIEKIGLQSQWKKLHWGLVKVPLSKVVLRKNATRGTFFPEKNLLAVVFIHSIL